MFYLESFFRNAKCIMKNIVLSLSYELTITEVYVSLPIYSILLQGKDIKLQCQGCFASDRFSWLKPQILKP